MIRVRYYLLGLGTLLCLGLFSYQISFALLSSTASSNNNTFIASNSFPTPTPQIAIHLVLNEVLYDTSSDQNINGQGGSNRGEFVEVYNPTGDPVNLNNWTISDDSGSETLTSITILSHGFLIITGATSTEFSTKWSTPVGTVFFQASNGTIINGFDNAGGKIILKDSSSNIIDQVSWGGDSSILNPAPPDVLTGHSLEREPDGKDTDTAGDFVDRTTPLPGI